MQSYNKDSNDKEFTKKLLSDFFGFLKYKVDNDLLTLDELNSIAHIIVRDIPLRGTAEDIAGYFHQPTSNIRNVISRRMLSKPVRRVMYSFLDFCKIAPSKWKQNITYLFETH